MLLTLWQRSYTCTHTQSHKQLTSSWEKNELLEIITESGEGTCSRVLILQSSGGTFSLMQIT